MDVCLFAHVIAATGELNPVRGLRSWPGSALRENSAGEKKWVWPGLAVDLENELASCPSNQSTAPNDPKCALHQLATWVRVTTLVPGMPSEASKNRQS